MRTSARREQHANAKFELERIEIVEIRYVRQTWDDDGAIGAAVFLVDGEREPRMRRARTELHGVQPRGELRP